jgi:hypothetical protein
MQHRFWLALALLALGYPCPASAQENSRPMRESLPQPRSIETDFTNYIPDDAVAFVHVRVSSLFEKLKLKGRIDSLLPVKMGWESTFGVPLTDVESFTLIGMPGEPGTMAFLVSTSTPVKESSVLKLCPPDSSKKTIQGKACVVHANAHAAVCVLNPKSYLFAPSEAILDACLKQAAATRDDETLGAALQCAGQHDLSAWVAFHRVTGMTEFNFLPQGVESASVTLDVGEELSLCVRIACEDDYAREWTAKGMKAGIDLMRGQALMLVGMLDGTSLVGSLTGGEAQEFQGLPMKLIRLAEKGLQQTKVRSEESSVTMSVTMPIDAKTLRTELLSAVRLMNLTGEGMGCHQVVMSDQPACLPMGIALGGATFTPGMTLPSPQYLQHQPQYFPPDPQFPLPRELASQTLPPQAIPQPAMPQQPFPFPSSQMVPSLPPPTIPPTGIVPASATMPPPMPQAARAVPTAWAAPPVQPAQPVPTVTPGPVPSVPTVLPPSAPPSVPSVYPPAPPVPANTTVPSAQFKVSVANVRKETALLFTATNDGKMNFVRKVEAGDAVDLDASAGQKWVAVFTGNPAAETKTMTAGEKVWLLR